MRILLVLIAAAVLVLFVLLIWPAQPWLKRKRERHEESGYRPARTIDPSNPPPAVPEPEDDLGPGDRDVPPGSRRDRQRHGKP